MTLFSHLVLLEFLSLFLLQQGSPFLRLQPLLLQLPPALLQLTFTQTSSFFLLLQPLSFLCRWEDERKTVFVYTVFNSQRLLFYCSWDLNRVLNWERWQLSENKRWRSADYIECHNTQETAFLQCLLYCFSYLYTLTKITRIVFIFIYSASILLFQLLQTFFLF